MYTIRQLAKDRFQIASFDDYKEPTAIYFISDKRCSCPARNPCKHQINKLILTERQSNLF